jgi:hypothetical protein
VNQTWSSDVTLAPRNIQDDDDEPDLGYHYDPLDYLLRNVTIDDATVRLDGGVAVGVMSGTGEAGIVLTEDGHLMGEGSPVARNWIVRYPAVQEQSLAQNGGTGIGGLIGTALNSLSGTVQLRFTTLAGQHDLLRSDGLASVDFRDCEFHGGQLSVSGWYPDVGDWSVQNCLLGRVRLCPPFYAVSASFLQQPLLGRHPGPGHIRRQQLHLPGQFL